MVDTIARLEGVRTTLGMKAPCYAATTGNVSLSGEQTIDGVVLVENDRCLVKNQIDATTNGVYVVSTGEWVRAVDFDGNTDFVEGTQIYVTDGVAGSGCYVLVTGNPITIGTSNLVFARPTVVANPISPMDYGAAGDGVTDDTAAVQAAFDDAVDSNRPVYGLGKTYLIDNLSIKNRDNGAEFEPVLKAYGQGATLKKRSSADNAYLVATERWISSSAFINYPFLLEDWTLDGNDIATNVLIDTAFASKVRYCYIKNGVSRNVWFPTQGKNASTNITSGRGGMIYDSCYIYSCPGIGLANDDTASTGFISDASILRCEILQNGQNINLQQTAGWFIMDNRVYSHTNTGLTEGAFIEEGFAVLRGNIWGHALNNASYCLTIGGEFFPITVIGDSFQTENAAELGLNVSFGSGARIAQVIGCRFEGTACGLNHGGNSVNNELISRDNTFDMAVPYTFSGGSSHAGIMRVEGDRANNADPAVISPSQITANQNDYNPTGLQYANVLRLTTDASRNITGLQKGYFGRKLMVMNVGSNDIVLTDDDGATSTAANRFEFGGNILVAPSEAVELWYDTTSSRWRLRDRGPLVRLGFANTGAIASGGSPLDLGGGNIPGMQALSSGVTAAMLAARFSNDASPARYRVGKSRNATVGSHTIVQSGDVLGEFVGQGSNGATFNDAASVSFEVDGAPSSGTGMPGRIGFKTSPSGSATPVERARIDQAGNVIMPYSTVALSTAATDGFLYIPTSTLASTATGPTATPSTYAGHVPMLYNTAQNRLWIFSGGNWRVTAALTTV